MRVAVIGLGSMGKRRIRLLKKYNDVQVIGIDNNADRKWELEKEYGIECYSGLNHAIDAMRIDCAFVCAPPLSHSTIIAQALKNKLHVFTELNLSAEGYEENITLAKQNNLVLFLSSTFLYREEIKKIKTLTKEAGCALNYTYHVGQYLPDWHPWESYKDYFVSDKRSNGCREILAIELPWLSDVFGGIINVNVVKDRMSSLNINYNDNYLIILEHSSGCKGTLAVDVVSRKAVRNLEVFGEQLYLCWNGLPTGLFVYDINAKKDINLKLYNEIDQLDNYSGFIVENAYLNEIDSFLKAVNEGMTPIYNFEKDRLILEIIDRIEA